MQQAIRKESDYTQALTLIEAILDETRNTPAREDVIHPLDQLGLQTSAGRRTLNVRQNAALRERFHVWAEMFIERRGAH